MDCTWGRGMNDSGREHYDDEIDLFEIVEILWQGKWIIVASVFIALAASYAYLRYKPTIYQYTIPYSSVLSSVAAINQCDLEQKQKCIDSIIFSHFLPLSTLPISLDTKKRNLSLTSTDPNYATTISAEINKVESETTQALKDDATFELQLINADTPSPILNTEIIASNYSNAKRLLNSISNGRRSIEFQSVVKTVKSPKVTLVLALSVVMGGIAGLFFIFLLRMVAAYKNRQQVAM